MPERAKKRVAILGGGPSGLATALELTRDGGDDLEITIYQMGFRVGGKGTSGYRHWTPPGSDRPIWNRIEEHGLHILFGFYETFFRAMRECYTELDRQPPHPLATFEDAFRGRNFGTAMYRHESIWKQDQIFFAANDAAPGIGEALDPEDKLQMLGSVLSNFLLDLTIVGDPNALRSNGKLSAMFRVIGGLAKALSDAVRPSVTSRPALLLGLLDFWQQHLRHWTRRLLYKTGKSYLVWLAIDFFVALTKGMIEADLLRGGDYRKLDHLDYNEWLEQNGVHRDTAVSPFVTMIYHAAFSYEEGEPDKPRIAAGSALRIILRAAMGYRGSAYYQMCGGMGEVVFVPLLRVLQERGVKFAFFHRVEALRLDREHKRVSEIEIKVQARLAAGVESYEPTIVVKGVEAFPSEPLYAQLENGDALRSTRFESYYESRFPTGEPKTLRRGHDFDLVVIATPVATLPYLAKDLLEHSLRWRNMVEHTQSVQTLSLQIWFNRTHAVLGWNQPSEDDPHTLLSMYWKPLSTWCPMDQTLPREQWPEGMEPKAVSYFTGAQRGPRFAPDPAKEPDFPDVQLARARIQSESFVENHLAEDLLPELEIPLSPPLPRFEFFHDPSGGQGISRLDAQYVRSNCEPSERVTLALPGETRYRMKAGETGYENVIVTGDWIDNGILVACMEGAFTSGTLSARAVREWLDRS